MTTKNKKLLLVIVPLIVVITATVIKYRGVLLSWAGAGTQNSFLAPLKTLGHKIVFLPKNDDLAVRQVFSKTGQIVFTSGGEILELNNKTDLKTVFTAENYPDLDFGTATKVGNNYFIAGDQKFVKFDSKGKLLKTYTTDDGLVNAFNLRFYADPYDPASLWVQTFDGLSKLDTKTDKFKNYKDELGLGSLHGVSSLVFTKDAVWGVIGANSSSGGGVDVMDRKTGTWQSYGPGSFGDGGKSMEEYGGGNRVDVDALIANEEYILARVHYDIYSFNKQTKKWEVIGQVPGDDNTYSAGLWSEGNYLYTNINGVLNAAEVKTNNLVWNKIDAQHENQALIYDDAGNLWQLLNNRTLNQVVGGHIGQGYNIPQREFSVGDFVAASEDAIYYLTHNGFHRYEPATGKTSSWAEPKNETGYYADTRVITEQNGIATLIYGEIGGYGGPTDIDIYQLSLSDTRSVKHGVIPGKMLEFENEIGLANDGSVYYKRADQKKAKKFDWNTQKFVDINDDWKILRPTLQLFYNHSVYYSSGPLENGAKFDYNTNGSTTQDFHATVTKADGSIVKIDFSTLAPLKPGPFNAYISRQVNSVEVDKENPNLLWVATNSGLIKVDLQSGRSSAYWAGNGIPASDISMAQSLKDYLALSTNSGIFILKKSDLK